VKRSWGAAPKRLQAGKAPAAAPERVRRIARLVALAELLFRTEPRRLWELIPLVRAVRWADQRQALAKTGPLRAGKHQ
jgi:hypothetical protein